MNKKLVCNWFKRNIFFFILTIFTTITCMIELCNALDTIKAGGTLNSVHYTLFGLKMDITKDTYNHVYSIGNYPLMPILAGVITNIYYIFIWHKNKEN